MSDHPTEWRAKLREKLAELEALDAIAAEGRSSVELDQSKVGRLSRMDALQGQAMNNAISARRKQDMLRTKAALARLDSGEFGYCIRCGEDIPVERLTFDPTVPTCGTCEDR